MVCEIMHDGYLPVCNLLSMTIINRICDYIKYGWDMFLIDPVGGADVQNKLQATSLNRKSEDIVLLQTIPNINDTIWTKDLQFLLVQFTDF